MKAYPSVRFRDKVSRIHEGIHVTVFMLFQLACICPDADFDYLLCVCVDVGVGVGFDFGLCVAEFDVGVGC